MYRKPVYQSWDIGSCEIFEGETIEQKMERVLNNGEPITDGAPDIFTERKDGVIAAYNIRTDRFEIACEAMDKVSASIAAKRDGIGLSKEADMKVVDDKSSTGTDGEGGA